MLRCLLPSSIAARTLSDGWSIAVIHLSIPNAERCTRWRTDDPFKIVIGYRRARQLAVFALVTVPWTAVRLVCFEIKSPETFAVERPPSSIGLGHNRALAVHFHDSSSVWIAYDLVGKSVSGIPASTSCGASIADEAAVGSPISSSFSGKSIKMSKASSTSWRP